MDNNRGSLKSQMEVNIKWMGIGQIASYIIQFIVWVVLARSVPSSNLGALGIALAFLNLAFIVNDMGMGTALIQKKQLTESHKITAFWLSLGMGLFFLFTGVLISPFMSVFFVDPIIKPLIVIFSFRFLVDSFGVIHEVLLKKELLFKKLMIIEIYSGILFGITAIFMLYEGMGIVSIAWGYLLKSILRTVLLYRHSDFIPNFKFDINSFNELFPFGKNIIGFKILSYVSANIDIILIGKLLGTKNLGYYSLALALVNVPRQKLSFIVSQVALSAFSKIQDHLDEVKSAYERLICYASIVNFPLLIGLLFVAPEFISVVYSQKWIEMALPLQILCVYGIFTSITMFVGAIFTSCGYPEYLFKFSFIGLLSTIISVLTGVRYGLAGVAVALSINAIIMNVIGNILIKKIIKISLVSYFWSIVPAFKSSIFMVIVMSIFRVCQEKYLGAFSDIWNLLILILVGIAAYLGSLFILNRNTFLEVKGILYRTIK